MLPSALLAVTLLNQTTTGLKLVWSDEFNYQGRPDPTKWTYETGFVRNKELQWYQPENVRVEGGRLIIEGKREKKPNPNYVPGSDDWKLQRTHADYTSGCIKTSGLHRWTYGRWEMRGRLDIRPGLWPAWWTVGEAREWPAGGEIDMLEFIQGNILANCCWGSKQRWVGIWDDSRTPVTALAKRRGYASAEDWAEDFHVWRMDWDKDWIRFYLDSELLNEVDLSKTINQSADGKNPFHEPHHMILNLAIGSTGGDPSQTQFPAKFEVDWVRLYQ